MAVLEIFTVCKKGSAASRLSPDQRNGVLSKGKADIYDEGKLTQGMIRAPLVKVHERIGRMDTRDELTQKYFNGKATVDTGGTIFEVNGKALSAGDYIGLTGAPDGSAITVRQGAAGIELIARNPAMFDWPAEFSLVALSGTSDTMLLDEAIMIKKGLPAGIGLRLFGRQAMAAEGLGIETIALEAAGSAISSTFNGYYTWPRYGFDAGLTAAEVARLPKHLSQAATIADLMDSESGRRWWLANGAARFMEFDLTAGSRSWQTLCIVLKEKGVTP